MRRMAKVTVVGVVGILLVVDQATACRFRLFRRACRPCPMVCYDPCPPMDGGGWEERPGTTVTIPSHELRQEHKSARPLQPDMSPRRTRPDSPVAPSPRPKTPNAGKNAKPSNPLNTKPTDKPAAKSDALPDFDLPLEKPNTNKKPTNPADDLPEFDLPSEKPAAKRPADDLPEFDLPSEKPAAKADTLPSASKAASKPADDLPEFDLPAEKPATKPATKPADDLPDFDLPSEKPAAKPAPDTGEDLDLDLPANQPAKKPASDELDFDLPSGDKDSTTAKPTDDALDLGDDLFDGKPSGKAADKPSAADDLDLDLDATPPKKAKDDVDDLFEDSTTQSNAPASDDQLADGEMPAAAETEETVDGLFGATESGAGAPPADSTDDELDFDLSSEGFAPTGPDGDAAEPADRQASDPKVSVDAPEAGGSETLALAEATPIRRATEREWIDNTGKFRVNARLMELLEGQVRLLKENGRYTTVPFSRLSDADREYLEQFIPPAAVRTAQAF